MKECAADALSDDDDDDDNERLLFSATDSFLEPPKYLYARFIKPKHRIRSNTRAYTVT